MTKIQYDNHLKALFNLYRLVPLLTQQKDSQLRPRASRKSDRLNAAMSMMIWHVIISKNTLNDNAANNMTIVTSAVNASLKTLVNDHAINELQVQ